MKLDLKKYYNKPQRNRRQHKPPYYTLPHSVLEKIRIYLLKEFNSKCAYCESQITITSQGDFDHFRPKSSARGLNEEFSLDHYWTLAFDWKNMYLCCETCNRYKLNWFPVEGKRVSITNTYEQIIKKEQNLIIDPCHENPALHLAYKEDGMVSPMSGKGEVTIDILKLNRKELVESRREKYLELAAVFNRLSREKKESGNNRVLTLTEKGAVNSLVEWISEINKSKSTRDFLGIQRYFMGELFKENTTVIELLLRNDTKKIISRYLAKLGIKYHLPANSNSAFSANISEEKKSGSTARSTKKATITRFSIESIEIENFKAIEKLTIKFPQSQNKKEPWMMLLGENGVGKSSFLQAVTLALMGENYRRKMDIKASEILKNGATQGFVKIRQVDQPPIELHFTDSTIHNNIKSASTYLLAYGSTRLFPSKNIKPERTLGYVRARNMFDPSAALFADNWLLSIHEKNRKQFDFACRALKAMLSKEMEDPNISFRVVNNNVVLHYSTKEKKPDKLRSLSDGYKSVIALACDMMYALMQGNSTMEVAEGIVILDEIGTHLHPRWKMRVVHSFREAFPKLQFIVTTHDPLCLKGLYAGEIFVFDKDENKQVYSMVDLPDPGEYRADQLLASRFFGLSSTIDDELEKDFNEYYSLLGKKEKTSIPEKQSLELLKTKLRDKKHLGNSLREELAFTAVDAVLSNERINQNVTPIEELKKQTVSILQDLWDKPLNDQEQAIKA